MSNDTQEPEPMGLNYSAIVELVRKEIKGDDNTAVTLPASLFSNYQLAVHLERVSDTKILGLKVFGSPNAETIIVE